MALRGSCHRDISATIIAEGDRIEQHMIALFHQLRVLQYHKTTERPGSCLDPSQTAIVASRRFARLPVVAPVGIENELYLRKKQLKLAPASEVRLTRYRSVPSWGKKDCTDYTGSLGLPHRAEQTPHTQRIDEGCPRCHELSST